MRVRPPRASRRCWLCLRGCMHLGLLDVAVADELRLDTVHPVLVVSQPRLLRVRVDSAPARGEAADVRFPPKALEEACQPPVQPVGQAAYAGLQPVAHGLGDLLAHPLARDLWEGRRLVDRVAPAVLRVAVGAIEVEDEDEADRRRQVIPVVEEELEADKEEEAQVHDPCARVVVVVAHPPRECTFASGKWWRGVHVCVRAVE